jgi:ATP-dependent helicase HrpB
VYGAANRLAALRGEEPGQSIAYTTRFDQKKSPAACIEVVTEGIFLRMIQKDPELTGISFVIFDEFHERSVANDLGLAFALESQLDLREKNSPLKILVMSATLDGDALSSWLQAPLIKAEERTFPVATYYHPAHRGQRLETHLAGLIQLAVEQYECSALVFLPGMREINRVFDILSNSTLPPGCHLYKLHASLPQTIQATAIAPPYAGARKIVLTTNVAETSVTIEGITIVIDSGQARIARYDERRAMNVLHTENIAIASAEQRRGRAGRLAPGVCFRAWSEAEHQKRQAFSDPEITRTDLLPVALELAIWGCNDMTQLKLLTRPNKEALKRASDVLIEMGALRPNGTITPQGQRIAALGVHPRLAKLILAGECLDKLDNESTSAPTSAAQSASIAAAAILSEGDPLRFGNQLPQSNFAYRLSLWQAQSYGSTVDQSTWFRIKKLTHQLRDRTKCQWAASQIDGPNLAIALAQAFPDHIAQLRNESQYRYRLATGKGAKLQEEDSLAGQDYLIVLDVSGSSMEPVIRLAHALTHHQLKQAMRDRITTTSRVYWDEKNSAVESVEETKFRQLILHRKSCSPDSPDKVVACLLFAIRTKGIAQLPWRDDDRALQQRIRWIRTQAPDDWPDCSDPALLTSLEDWLAPYLTGMTRFNDLHQLSLSELLTNRVGWDKQSQLDAQAPKIWTLPTGSERIIQYNSEQGPSISARMQELYGLRQHPTIGRDVPITIEILSPAQRPIQVTRDLPRFWNSSYADIAKEMRGRYPKHLWPEDPASAQATTKTKRHHQS